MMKRFLITFKMEFDDDDDSINEESVRMWIHDELGVLGIDVIEILPFEPYSDGRIPGVS